MRVLTLWEPYATLLARGIKPTETRGWPPPPALLGEVLGIHAGGGVVSLPRPTLLTLARLVGNGDFDRLGRWYLQLPRRHLIATLRVRGCRRIAAVDGELVTFDTTGTRWRTPADASDEVLLDPGFAMPLDPWGDYRPGRYVWFVTDRQLVRPVPLRGRQGIWTWDGEAVAA